MPKQHILEQMQCEGPHVSLANTAGSVHEPDQAASVEIVLTKEATMYSHSLIVRSWQCKKTQGCSKRSIVDATS